MLMNRKIVVVMPAYNAAKTLEKTFNELPHDIVDHVVLVDDYSTDETIAVAKKLGADVIVHQKNLGYGGNQKTCYARALELGADIVIMVHPDYQYTPRLVRAMSAMISEDVYDVVLGSRILGVGALSGGMPLYKYFFNRILTAVENILIGQKLSEFHSGYRAYSSKVLRSIRTDLNSNDFVFDNQVLVQCHAARFRIGEISCPTLYFADASSINFRRSMIYGIGCLWTGSKYLLQRIGIKTFPEFVPLTSSLEYKKPENSNHGLKKVS